VKTRSIRFVLTGWYSLLLLVACGIFGFGVYMYLERMEKGALEQNLLEEVDWISRIVEIERSHLDSRTTLDSLSNDVEDRIFQHFTVSPRNYIVNLSSSLGVLLYSSENFEIELPITSGMPPNRLFLTTVPEPGKGSLLVASRREDPFIIQVGYTETVSREVMGRLLSIFGVLLPVVLFISFASGWWMAGVVLRPVSQISRLATRITAENLNERIPERGVRDELGELITTINGMIGRLQTSFEHIKNFSLRVAHELKTPLTIMKGETELALGKALTPEEAQGIIASTLEEIVRMSRIVDNLLTLSKADAGQIAMEHQTVELSALIQELCEDALTLAAGKQIEVACLCPEKLHVLGDPDRLHQLFRAILTNAVQFTDSGGRIRLQCTRSNKDALVEIEDTGIGIPPGDLEKIFEPFYRSEDARTRVKSGSGLGLSIAQWIVRAHKGTIRARSDPGKGSCFSIRLPLH
jgi:heavy metal sensor kinase